MYRGERAKRKERVAIQAMVPPLADLLHGLDLNSEYNQKIMQLTRIKERADERLSNALDACPGVRDIQNRVHKAGSSILALRLARLRGDHSLQELLLAMGDGHRGDHSEPTTQAEADEMLRKALMRSKDQQGAQQPGALSLKGGAKRRRKNSTRKRRRRTARKKTRQRKPKRTLSKRKKNRGTRRRNR
jgi:hypothetical protein